MFTAVHIGMGPKPRSALGLDVSLRVDVPDCNTENDVGTLVAADTHPNDITKNRP